MNRVFLFFCVLALTCSATFAMSEKTISLCFKNDTPFTVLVDRSYIPRGRSVAVEIPKNRTFDITPADVLPFMKYVSCRFLDRNEHYRRTTAPIELSHLTGGCLDGLVIAKNGTIFEVTHTTLAQH